MPKTISTIFTHIRTMVMCLMVSLFFVMPGNVSPNILETKISAADHSPVLMAQATKTEKPVKKKKAKKKTDLLTKVTQSEMRRFGITDKKTARGKNLMAFLDMTVSYSNHGVPESELNGGLSAFAPTTKGSFKGGPLETALNRADRYATKYKIKGMKPLASIADQQDPRILFSVSKRDQMALVLMNLSEQRGTDRLLISVMEGDMDAAAVLIEKFHVISQPNLTQDELSADIAKHVSKFSSMKKIV